MSVPTLAKALNQVEHRMILALSRYYYLTNAQYCRMFFSPTVTSYSNSYTKGLKRLGYIDTIPYPKVQPVGRQPDVFKLTDKGRKYLAEAGIELRRYSKPSDDRTRSYMFLSHTLAVNDVLIGAERTGKAIDIRHELELKCEPVKVETGKGERVIVVPDGFVDFGQYPVVFEIDRGTEDQRDWRKKIRGLVIWMDKPYQAAFETTAITIAVVAVADDQEQAAHRARLLRTWTAVELEKLGKRDYGRFFFFTASPVFNPDRPSESWHQSFYYGAHWRTPFTTTPEPLLVEDAHE